MIQVLAIGRGKKIKSGTWDNLQHGIQRDRELWVGTAGVLWSLLSVPTLVAPVFALGVIFLCPELGSEHHAHHTATSEVLLL